MQPAPPVGTVAIPLLIDGVTPALSMPTLALISLMEVALEEGLPLTMSDELTGIENLPKLIEPRGVHQLLEPQRITGEGTTDFIRCRTRILLTDRGPLAPYEIFLDFPTRYIGMMLNSARPPATVTSAPHVEKWSDTFTFNVPKPTWAGSFSFAPIWDSAARIMREKVEAELDPESDTWDVEPDVMFRAETLLHLEDAHLIRIEPEQVQVLPEWEEWGDLWDYARECAIPFDPVYLDFEGPGGIAPVHGLTVNMLDENGDRAADMYVHLKGAIVRHQRTDDSTDSEVSSLLIIPYGEVQQGERQWGGYYALGSFQFGTNTRYPIAETEMTMVGRDGNKSFRTIVPSVSARLLTGGELADNDEIVGGLPGAVTLPFTPAQFIKATGSTQKTLNENLVAWASVVMSCTSRVMAALSIMETECVVIEDTVLVKRDRDRAEKRGWKIAQMVYVRPTRKGGSRATSNLENHRDYSHRFWVSGHYKHFPVGTRVADTRLDLVRPCTRHGAAACPMGCRRIWTQPFIKGPEDKPLVPKTLVKRRQRDLEEVV